jgi:hypothetical protein
MDCEGVHLGGGHLGGGGERGPVQTVKQKETCAGIFEQSMGGQEPSRNSVVVPARQATTQPGGIGSLESILGLLKSLKIRALLKDWYYYFTRPLTHQD